MLLCLSLCFRGGRFGLVLVCLCLCSSSGFLLFCFRGVRRCLVLLLLCLSGVRFSFVRVSHVLVFLLFRLRGIRLVLMFFFRCGGVGRLLLQILYRGFFQGSEEVLGARHQSHAAIRVGGALHADEALVLAQVFCRGEGSKAEQCDGGGLHHGHLILPRKIGSHLRSAELSTLSGP